MKSVRNQLDLTFQELKGPYIYLVTIMSLVKIKFPQKRMKHCLPSARPIVHAACPESARPTLTPAKPSASTASAQIGLADSQSATPISLVPAAVDASLDDSALVDHSSEIKNHIIQIKDIHFSDMINKV
jgi:hypothetical protein